MTESETPTPEESPVDATDTADEAQDGQVAAAEPETADSAEESSNEPTPVIELAGLEALLFSTHHPLTAPRLAELLDVKVVKPVRDGIRELNKQYEAAGRAFRIEQVAGGFQMLTLPAYADLIKKHQQKEQDAKLGKAALETLAVIAYKQPILRVDVEAVRGVACGETIRGLMEKHLVKIAGRAEVPGRPILYGTTKRFLEVFGLNSIKDLPEQEDALAAKAKEMRAKRAEAKAAAGETVAEETSQDMTENVATEVATPLSEGQTTDPETAAAASNETVTPPEESPEDDAADDTEKSA
ncbi:MAG: SMC-Scp complex subunit ScpB [Tepidisphaeraceae bacterium]